MSRSPASGPITSAKPAVDTHVRNGEGLEVLRPLVFLGGLWAVWLLRAERG